MRRPHFFVMTVIVFATGGLPSCTTDAPIQHGRVVSPIYGGTPVPEGQDPAVVGVYNFQVGSICSGTLVAPRAVLTAAHCTAGSAASSILVVFGNSLFNGVPYTVAENFVHPSYPGNPDPAGHDVAVLVLHLDGPVQPVLLTPAPRETVTGQTARLVGFGRTEQYGSGVKFEVALPVVAELDETLVLFEPDKGACFGDSGGPAFLERDGQEVVAGVASFIFGSECGAVPSGYSRVDGEAHAWIQDLLDQYGGGAVCEDPDLDPPAVVCSPAIVECGGPLPTPLASDACGPAEVSCQTTSGSTDAVGLGEAACSATDPSGNISTCTLPFFVQDTRPPTWTTENVYLGAPDHKYHRVDLRDCIVQVTDQCEGDLDVSERASILVVMSNEPEDDRFAVEGSGDGATCEDAIIDSPTSVRVRAERVATGTGRVYTIFFRVSDASGNFNIGSCDVIVGQGSTSDPLASCKYCAQSQDPLAVGACDRFCPAAPTECGPGIPTAFVSGTVKNAAGTGVSGVSVGVESSFEFAALTDADGAYKLPALGAGTYRFNVSAPLGFVLDTYLPFRSSDETLRPGQNRLDYTVKENWAGASRGGRVVSWSEPTLPEFPPDVVIDEIPEPFMSWIALGSVECDVEGCRSVAQPEIVVELGAPVDLTEVVAWTCTTFEVQTSRDGKLFLNAGSAGEEAGGCEGILNPEPGTELMFTPYVVEPPAGAREAVRFLKLRFSAPHRTTPGFYLTVLMELIAAGQPQGSGG